MKNDFIKPILVLALICLVMSGALALTNGLTEPVIVEAASVRMHEAMSGIIPNATGFTPITDTNLPESVVEAYKSDNDAGYIFVVVTGGFGGDVKLICGVNSEGKVIHCTALEQSETKGLGSKITEPFFENQFDGKGAGLEGVEAITGATISSRAYISAVTDALAAFDIVYKGAG